MATTGSFPASTLCSWWHPYDGLGIVAFVNGSKGAFMWMETEFKRLLRRLLDVPGEVVRTDIPHHPEVWNELCGRYGLPRTSDLRQRLLMAGGVEVYVRGGRLMIRWLPPIPALYRGLPLQPDDERDPYVFRLDLSRVGMGTVRVVFGRDVASGAPAIHADPGGQPVSFVGRPSARRAWLGAGLAALSVYAAATAIRRRRRPQEIPR